LVDIGSGELRPFIFNSGVTITDANGVVVHKSLSDATQKKILAMNELPEGFDFAILSYPQMNTGDRISQEESGKAAKDKGEWGAKKGKAVKAGRPTPKADFLRRIAKDNYLLMDESQNAAGSGNTGAYFQSILKKLRPLRLPLPPSLNDLIPCLCMQSEPRSAKPRLKPGSCCR
jgi:hypothetical protein